MDSLIQTKQRHFPWDVFAPEFYENLKQISFNYNIPLVYLGAEALFTIGALAGNMYIGEVNGGPKPILYVCKIGPSSVGKTPAHKALCGRIIKPLRIEHDNDFQQKMKEYRQRERDARKAKEDFDEEPPNVKLRIIEGGTVEAVAKHSITSPAGFGVVYDEGVRMFGEATSYNKNGSSVEFWNEMWNGETMHLTRVDSTRERFIHNAGVSVNIGLQTDRMSKYFNEDAIQSGLLNRFLIVESGYMNLNEDVDLFSKTSGAIDEWRSLVINLFKRGLTYEPDKPTRIPFSPGAQKRVNEIAKQMVRGSNIHINSIRDGDASKYIANYKGKVYAYFTKICLILAIYKDHIKPIVTEVEADGADKLCQYFEQVGINVLRKLYDSSNSGLSEKEQELYDLLPESFTTEQAIQMCLALDLNKNFFNVTYLRKYSKGLIIKKSVGHYQKR